VSSHADTIRTTLNKAYYSGFSEADRDEALAALDALLAENQQLRNWAQQIHDALDGKKLPPHPDEAPARIQQLRDALAEIIEIGTPKTVVMGDSLQFQPSRSVTDVARSALAAVRVEERSDGSSSGSSGA
jgi:uncharacterized protein YukJ